MMPRARPHIQACARCAKTRPIAGRGLCAACHQWCRSNGRLEDYPCVSRNRPAAETAEEYGHLSAMGLSDREIADRLGFADMYWMRRQARAGTSAAAKPDLPHGHNRYKNHGCRCDVCKAANREYGREYRRRARAGNAGRAALNHTPGAAS